MLSRATLSPPSRQSSKTIITFVFVAFAIWMLVFALGGYKWYEMDAKELALVQGCYSVEGKPLFHIEGTTLVSGDLSWGFEGSHDKRGDVLTMNHPLQFSRSEHGKLVEASSATLVPVHYGPPLVLELGDDHDQTVQAVQVACAS